MQQFFWESIREIVTHLGKELSYKDVHYSTVQLVKTRGSLTTQTERYTAIKELLLNV